MKHQQFALGLACCFIAACANSDSDSNAPIALAKAPAIGAASESSSESTRENEPRLRTIGGIRFEIPGSWEENPQPSSVLLAEYQVPAPTGAARLTFSTAGGGKDANLSRWKDQFRRGPDDPEPTETSIKVAGKSATMIELAGSFTDMFGGGKPKSNWRLIGIAVPIEGEQNFFIKLTGPKETLESQRKDFDALLQSARSQSD
jgi:hypothetical protein